MNVVDFFAQSAGKWTSRRVTHHLAFRRAELGSSHIGVESLANGEPRIIDICKMHDVDPSLSVGGAYVAWQGVMGWDKEDENHEGSTVFALIPETSDLRKGTLLRERGYAEIVPVAGKFHIDDEDALVLTTDYDSMTIFERFWFVNPNLRMRSSTVQRMGGFTTATFCVESRELDNSEKQISVQTDAANAGASMTALSALGW
ncbi:MAG: phycobiliprotein lyase [Cyanobacteria bacterium P01_H01_bin.15]